MFILFELIHSLNHLLSYLHYTHTHTSGTALEAEYWITATAQKGYKDSILSFEPVRPKIVPTKLVERQAMSRSGGALMPLMQCMEAGDEDTWMSMEKMVKGPILGTLKNISLTMLTYAGLTYLGYKLFRSRVDSR